MEASGTILKSNVKIDVKTSLSSNSQIKQDTAFSYKSVNNTLILSVKLLDLNIYYLYSKYVILNDLIKQLVWQKQINLFKWWRWTYFETHLEISSQDQGYSNVAWI